MELESVEVARLKGAKQEFGPERSSEFRSAAEGAPFTLRTLGLGAGIATLAAKEDEARVFAAMVARWLLKDCRHSPYRSNQTPAAVATAESGDHRDERKRRAAIEGAWTRELLGRIGAGTRDEYRAAQIEAIGFATWLKRLAQAFCPKGEG